MNIFSIIFFSISALFAIPIATMMLDWLLWTTINKKLTGVEWGTEDRFYSVLIFTVISMVSSGIAASIGK
jgi:hypothetical protein